MDVTDFIRTIYWIKQRSILTFGSYKHDIQEDSQRIYVPLQLNSSKHHPYSGRLVPIDIFVILW